MERDKANDSTIGFPALAAFRGLYHRVATRLDVDPSYVSRVARGQRQSAAVLAALEEEIANIREQLNHHHLNGKGNLDGHHGPDGAASAALPALPALKDAAALRDALASPNRVGHRSNGNSKKPRR